MITQRQIMSGMDAHTGKAISALAHLKQSVTDILTTRIGTRIMRRDYGSNVPSLVDKPMNDALKLQIYTSVFEALDKWEPRIEVTAVQVRSSDVLGQLIICLVPYSHGFSYIFLQGVNLWEVYSILTPRLRHESEKKFNHLRRQSQS